MKIGIAALTLAYVLSQFYRAFLAVLAPELEAELGVGAAQLSRASGIWFLAFAAMQIPVGWALDRIGPRITASTLLALGGAGGAALFALAGAGWQIELAMGLIGIGCAPVLMASYYIFARTYRPAVFATLAATLVGVGSLGNIAASVPLGWAAETVGWRGALWALAAVTGLVALAVALLVRDQEAADGAGDGSLWDVLRIPAFWAILPMMLMNYAPAAGLRGLWAGPYIAESYGAQYVGVVTLVMGLAMIAGNFAYGPLDRLTGTRKGVVLGGNIAGALVLAALWWVPVPGLWAAAAALALVGALGSSYAVGMAHGRAFVPAHLTGRGVTLLNLFSIGGVGVMQFATGPIFDAAGGGTEGYRALFGLFALALAAGCAIYAFAPDRTD
ncbi:MFS transporter [Jannaschia aquimarina]|uniref:Major Facilitator Superfamily protein n=1 Tax=Jannaschia aquimarina TaxID=935700 RepID=A0A0D1CHQ5_9RHOB|nr:MFS transporter [Jannaschia aquimarina]KIT14227.1 Major Facilitator Superfamily protein [Jannaschia aquimarina]SNS48663.1 Cyanate permease [Jannaschia aquimarina]